MSSRTRLVVVLLVLVALLALAAPAFGVLSGRNGRIAFTSGRQAGDATAQIFHINPINLQPTVGPLSIPGVQNRHASWSPDRTKLVFAAGNGTFDLATEEFDLYVKDMVLGGIQALDASEIGDGKSSDHPAWSPDGTRIAYEHQPVDNSAERDIRVKTGLTSVDAVNLTTANAAPFQLKPAWSPDSSELYFAQSPNPTGATAQFDIVKKSSTAAANVATTNVLASATVDEYQPSIAPDGSKICFTRQSTLNSSATADVYLADLPGGGNQKNISDTPAPGSMVGDINCSYSPDGTKVAFSNGTFTGARLMTERVDDNDNVPAINELSDDPGSNDFDGNADWGVDGSPDCPDTNVTALINTPITINLECTDTGPAYERTDPNGFEANESAPQNGTTSDSVPLADPSTTKYTPNPGFVGTDTIVYTSFDDFGFGTDKGTVTITVKRKATPGGGEVFDGTAGNDTINGTPGPDVITCGAGDDVVDGGGGDDVINCGAGNDRVDGGTGNDIVNGDDDNDQVVGNSGNDRVRGNSGNDRVNGNTGRDRVNGDSGNDRINGDSGNDRVGGDSGNDRASGGLGNDRVSGGSGRDRVSGGRGNDRVRGNSGNDRVGGDSGNDRVSGDSGRDRLSGGSGRDRLNGGSSRDRCDGGRGRDRASRCERRLRIP